MTNALKHGRPGDPIDVQRTWTDAGLTLRVVNPTSAPPGEEGMGLGGVRSRLAAVDGSLRVAVTRTGAVDANGDEHNLDVIVMATGFDAANYLGNFTIHGQHGADLHETWKGEPEALLGMMVPRFPNFFIMYGPNTNSVPLVSFYEAQASFAASLIAKAAKTGKTVIEVRRSAFVVYNDLIQAQLAKTVWATANNYFRAGTGRIVSQWPFGATPYILATKLARRIAVRLS